MRQVLVLAREGVGVRFELYPVGRIPAGLEAHAIRTFPDEESAKAAMRTLSETFVLRGAAAGGEAVSHTPAR